MPTRRSGAAVRMTDVLGQEMLVNVLSFCLARDLARMECVSKCFREKSIAATPKHGDVASAERVSLPSQAAKICCERVKWRRLLYHFEGAWMDWKVQFCFLEMISPHGVIPGHQWPFVSLDIDLVPAPPRPSHVTTSAWDSDSEPEELDEDFGTKNQQVRSMLHFAAKVASSQVSHAELLKERQELIEQRELHELSAEALELLAAEDSAALVELAVLGRDHRLLRRALRAGADPNALINSDPSDPRHEAETGEEVPALFCAIDMRPPNYEAIKLLLLAGARHQVEDQTGESFLTSAFDLPGVREHSALFFAASGGLAWGESFGGEENRPVAKALSVRVLLDHGVRADQTHRVHTQPRQRHSWLDDDADDDADDDDKDHEEEEADADAGEEGEGAAEGVVEETAVGGLVRKLQTWAGQRRPGRQWLHAVTERYCPLFLELLQGCPPATLRPHHRRWVPAWVLALAAHPP